MPHYIIYGYTPLFILMADETDRLQHRWGLLPPVWVFLCLFLALPLLAPYVAPRVEDTFARLVIEGARDAFTPAYFAALSGVLAFTIALLALPRRLGRSRLVLTGTALCLVVNFVLMPTAGKITQEPIRHAAALAREKGLEVTLWKMNTPSFIFYYGSPVDEDFPKVEETVLTKATYRDVLAPVRVLYEKNGILLATRIRPSEAE